MKLMARALCAGLCTLAAAGVPVFTPAFAQVSEAERTARIFGIRSSVLDISLSPSGTKLAWISPGPGHTEVLNVFDLESDEPPQQIVGNSEVEADLGHCDWASDDRLVCQVYYMSDQGDFLVPFDRMFSISADGEDIDQLTRRAPRGARGYQQDGGSILALDVEGNEGSILMTNNQLRGTAAFSRLGNRRGGLGVDLVDVTTGSRRRVVAPDDDASFYLADENGAVRFKIKDQTDRHGILTGERDFMVRSPGESRWRAMNPVTLGGQEIERFSPISLNVERNSLYAYRTINGFRAVIEVPLDGGEASVVAARDDVDVGSLIRIGRQRRVVGVSFATEKVSVEYFDQELAALADGLARALPDQPLIRIAGASADESRLLIIGSSDTNAGMVYLYHKDTRQLEQLLPMRQFLDDRDMGEMQPITYTAADGVEIPGYLTLPAGSDGQGLPAVVLPHGGPAARDFWGFDWLVQFFTANGYAVLQPNYRGSSGYGAAWFGRNGYQAWDVAIGDVNDAGRWLVSEGIANPDQLAIVGWSYGGYAALQSQVVDPNLFKAVVAIAPVTDLEYLREDAENYTSARLRDEQLGEGPHIEAGSPRLHAASFQSPVALFHGTLDLNVDVRHSQDMAKALEDAGKQVSYTEFEDLQHGLSDSNARARMLYQIQQFLSAELGG